MRSTRRLLSSLIALAALSVPLSACAAHPPAQISLSSDTQSPFPSFAIEGSRFFEYESLEQLAAKASAIVVVSPTGNTSNVALPAVHGGTAHSAPTPFIEMRVEQVLSGSLDADVIDLVSPGFDARTQKQRLSEGGPFLVFITPAMYDRNDPVGGYVAVGGPAGVYAATGDKGTFARVDHKSPRLPATVTLGKTALPHITHTEEELLRLGP